jgi:N-methylhydantoinase A
MRSGNPDIARAREEFAILEAQGVQALQTETFSAADINLFRSLDMRYVGQAHEVNVPITGDLTENAFAGLAGEFHRRHEEQFGHSAPGEPVEVVNLRVTAIGRVKRPAISYKPRSDSQPLIGRRKVYFKEAEGWLDCPVYLRATMPPGFQLHGPAILEEHTSTVVVPPDFRAEIDAGGNVVLQR